MKKIRFIVPLIAAGILSVTSCGKKAVTTTATETAVLTTTEVTTTEESSLHYRTLSDSVNEYYKNVDTSLEGDDFLASLTPVISKNYQKYSYKGAWEVLAKADEDPYNPDNVICAYTGKSIPKNLDSDSKAWNREHTWAKSHGFPSEGNSAYTDCHHLTATSSDINNARGDLDFGEVEDYTGTVSKDAYGNEWIADTVFEPRDEVKGDVARRLFYMMARYNTTDLDLTLTDEVPTSASKDGTGKLGKLSTLLKWHYEDPVSDTEIRRNEVIYSYQNNRNPFIDHPEWVNNAFDSAYENVKIDEESVKKVTDAIDSEIPETVTLEDKETIASLFDEIYDLNAQEKLYVYNYEKLTAAQSQISYLEDNSGDSDADITCDFTSIASSSTGGYVTDKTVTVNDHSFTASSVYIGGGEFRLGTKNPADLSEFGISESGVYLKADFSVTGLERIVITASKTYSSTTGYYLLKEEDGVYTELGSGEIDTSCILIDVTNDAFNGSFVFILTGDQPRMAISEIELYCEK